MTTYQQVISRRADGTYVRRIFFPETYTMTSFETFSDPLMRNAQGPYTSFSDEGKLKIEGQYAANEKTGTWKYYRPKTGLLREKGNYLADEKEGEWTAFDSEERKTQSIAYRSGEMMEKITYDSTGVVINHFRYADEEIVEVLVGEKPAEEEQQIKMPLFPGCGAYTEESYEEVKRCADRALLEFIYSHVRYPARARENGVEGMGIISFVIEEDGKVNDLEVVRGLNQDISLEMVRIVALMPDWTPGVIDGEKKRVQFNLPVKFKLE